MKPGLMHLAERAVERSDNTSALIAVFAAGETIRVTKTTTKLFEVGCECHTEQLVGVYDQSADPRQIVEDALVTMEGIAARKATASHGT